MRKLLLFIVTIVCSLSFAQQIEQSKVFTFNSDTFGNKAMDKPAVNKTSGFSLSKWISYKNAYENFYGQYGTASLNENYLFPDTTVIVRNGNSFTHPTIHSISCIYDFKADVYYDSISPPSNFCPFWEYTLDSIKTSGIYSRQPTSTAIDTMVIRFYETSANNLGSRSYFYNSGINTNLSTDTVFIVNFDWDYSSLEAPGAFREIRILMDDAFAKDTTDEGYHEINEYLNEVVYPQYFPAYSGLLGVTIDFRPGYTWNSNIDTLDVNVNSWKFLSWELNGPNSFPFYKKEDYNVSNILPKEVRYNNAGGWNDSYIPSYAYMGSTPSYAYESHEIKVHITQEFITGIEENTKIDFNVYPNPSNGAINVRFGTIVNGEYNVRLVNIIGQEVYSENTIITSGQTKSFNFENLDKGVYLLNVNGNGFSTVQKVTIR